MQAHARACTVGCCTYLSANRHYMQASGSENAAVFRVREVEEKQRVSTANTMTTNRKLGDRREELYDAERARGSKRMMLCGIERRK